MANNLEADNETGFDNIANAKLVRDAYEDDLKNGEDYYRSFVRYASRILRDEDLALDAVQEVYMYLHKKGAESYDQRVIPGGLKANPRLVDWIYASVRNECIDIQRKRRRKTQSLDGIASDHQNVVYDVVFERGTTYPNTIVDKSMPTPETIAILNEDGKIVTECLADLTDPQKKILRIIYFERSKYREAASQLGIPIGTVRSRLHSAIRSLSRVIEHRYGLDNLSDPTCLKN